MNLPIESGIVHIPTPGCAIVGAGMLVGKRHVFTCTRVVADALSLQSAKFKALSELASGRDMELKRLPFLRHEDQLPVWQEG